MILKGCQFFGSIPESVGNLTVIKQFDLSFNNFTGHLEQLDYLDLLVNNFEGEISDVFSHFQKLTFLQLGVNKFSGRLPPSTTNLSELEVLDFHSNSLTAALPNTAERLKLQKLKYFSFNNSLSGVLPSWLFDLPSLRFLALSHNQFTGKIQLQLPFTYGSSSEQQ